MLSHINRQRNNKNCVYCSNNIKDSHFVLSDESYIHKECLEMLQLSFADLQVDQEMKQFYNFILSKVVNCNTCSKPLDLLHNDYMTLPLCSQCKPLNIFSLKKETQICELCDLEITEKNKLKKPSVVLGIIMCRICYNVQTGEIEQKLQQKPDLRHLNRKIQIDSLFRPKPISKTLEVKQNLKKIEECYDKQLLFQDSLKSEIQELETFGLQRLFKERQTEANKIPEIKLSCSKKEKLNCFQQQKVQKVPKLIQRIEKQETIITEVKAEEIQKYSLKECKICFNGQSQMMNMECRHLMMCQPCYKSMLKRQNKKNELCCPVCQTVGKYFKYLQPIYI